MYDLLLVHHAYGGILTVSAIRTQKAINVLVQRSGIDGLPALRLMPRQGWGGRFPGVCSFMTRTAERGSLMDAVHSCHVLPYVSPTDN
jgi:hypothetical protein